MNPSYRFGVGVGAFLIIKKDKSTDSSALWQKAISSNLVKLRWSNLRENVEKLAPKLT